MGSVSCSSWNKKLDVVNEFKRDTLKRYDILKEKSTTQGYWVAVENRETKERHIFFALIKKYGKEFTLKTMSEDMGPSYQCCPVSFFDIVPVKATGFGKEWRQSVLNSLETKKKFKDKPVALLNKGADFKLYGSDFTAQYQDGKNWIVLKKDNGKLYKLKLKQLKELELT